jgi:hypothetical protein
VCSMWVSSKLDASIRSASRTRLASLNQQETVRTTVAQGDLRVTAVSLFLTPRFLKSDSGSMV